MGIPKTSARANRELIRDFRLPDVDEVVEILQLNGKYGFKEVDGLEAMKRVKACKSMIFLVCESEGKVVGAVRGSYDGSRAVIHQLSVHPAHQRIGIGTALVKEAMKGFQRMRAPTTSATVKEKSLLFWEKVGFRKTKAFIARALSYLSLKV